MLRHALEIAFGEAGLTVAIVRDTEIFVRLAVGDGITETLVDLAWDARMRPAVSSDLGPVLDQEELAADKVLALFGRAEPRDFLDVYGLSQRLGWPRLLALAKQKDAGFSPERLAESLGRMDRLDQADSGIDDAALPSVASLGGPDSRHPGAASVKRSGPVVACSREPSMASIEKTDTTRWRARYRDPSGRP